MNKQAPVHISVILDRSGSMAAIADDVVGGFNTFIKDQKSNPGEARITLIQFDSEDPFEIVLDRIRLNKVKGIDPARYQPRGATPLYDAIGRTIARIDTTIADRADHGHPIEDQLVVIITDGLENASREYSQDVIRLAIRARRERAWTFMFLGANQDAVTEGVALGVERANTGNWDATKAGTGRMWDGLSQATTAHRTRSRTRRHRDRPRLPKSESSR